MTEKAELFEALSESLFSKKTLKDNLVTLLNVYVQKSFQETVDFILYSDIA